MFHKLFSKQILLVASILITLIAIGSALFFYVQARDLKQNPQKVAGHEVSDIVKRVGSLIVLPENESPTVATVTNPEELKNQPFFVHAVAGDKVLIYSQTRKAILFRPSENKIIEVAPLNIAAPKNN